MFLEYFSFNNCILYNSYIHIPLFLGGNPYHSHSSHKQLNHSQFITIQSVLINFYILFSHLHESPQCILIGFPIHLTISTHYNSSKYSIASDFVVICIVQQNWTILAYSCSINQSQHYCIC